MLRFASLRFASLLVIPCVPCIPCVPVYSPVFPVFPCVPGIPGYYRVYPVFPCIPVYSRCVPVRARPARPVEPRGPFLHGARGPADPVSDGVPGRVGWGTPLVMYPTPPMGGWGTCPGGTTPHHAGHHVRHRVRRAPRAVQERPSGLNGPRGDRVGGGAGGKAAGVFPYLRSFWPGGPEPAKPVPDNRWIGSRSRPPKGGLDVSDLECLRPGCGKSRIRRRRSRIRRR